MLIRRVNGWDPFLQLREELSQILDNFAESLPAADRFGLRRTATFPALNVWEDAQNLYAEAELPGLKMEHLEVCVVGNELTIKGDRKDDHGEKPTYHRRERGTGMFSRVTRLPVDIDADRVDATLQNGVLLVTLPKAEKAKPRKVPVKAR